MSLYLSYFLHGLRQFCGQFPSENDLPDFAKNLPPVDLEIWASAMRLNYGKVVEKCEAVRLRSVFEFLKNEKTVATEYDFSQLTIKKDSIFPKEKGVGEFKNLLEGFKSEWSGLIKIQPEYFTDTLVFLSKKWFSNAGFSPDFPHISLHEHLKTTAALSDCLQQSDKNKALLVGAGLDNIQGFCYDISSSKAAKSLKGRSFFLQMLLDTIVAKIVSHEKIKAYLGHIVYARGGKLFLLLPDSPGVREALIEIKTELNAEIWTRYKTSLFMFLKYESFDVLETDFSRVWKTLQASIRIDKQQKNLEMLITESNFKKLFKPISEGFRSGDDNGEKQFCCVTGELIENADARKNNIESDPEKAKVWVSEAVKFQSELGEALRESTEYIQWQAKEGHEIDKSQPTFTGDKIILTVPEEGKWSLRQTQPLKNNFDVRFQFKLNNLDFLPASPNGRGYGFAFYGGNGQAIHETEGRVKFFSELAGRENENQTGEGFIRLGIGRMDVDGLGEMASKAEVSFALNATFSAHLDLFISGYINTIRAENPEFVEFLNIIFSGGDDLLIVGRWDLTLDFLDQLRLDFSKFQGGAFLTMSAGLVLVTDKFPIAKAVQMAGKAENRAKDFNKENPKTGSRTIPELPAKNALCFLDEEISWDQEFEFVQYFSKKLLDWLENKEDTGISMSLIFKIYRFYEMQRDGRPNWRWLCAWYFQQCEKKKIQRSEDIFYCLKLFVICGKWSLKDTGEIESKTFNISSNRALMLLSLAARVADFKNRKSKN